MSGYIKKINIQTYSDSTTYNKYNVVKVTSGAKEYYFVSTSDFNTGNLDNIGLTSNQNWKRFDDYNFFDFNDVWKPSYSSSAEFEARTVESSIGGATQSYKDGINNIPLKYDLIFENASDDKTLSLLCFFEFCGLRYSFYWTTPQPYNKKIAFKFNSFQLTQIQKNTNSMSVTLERSNMIFGEGAGQETT